MAGIACSGRQITKSCSTEAMNSSTMSLMTLEEFHFQATKRPIRGFVNDRFLQVEGLE